MIKWFVKTFLAKKFVSDLLIQAIFNCDYEAQVVDISRKDEGLCGVIVFLPIEGPTHQPILLKNKKCYLWKGILIWD